MTTTTTKLNLKKNDLVQVMAGRDKGKTGKILEVHAKEMRVTVEKVNMVKRHIKPSQQNPQGGILEKETTIHYSNVLLVCPKCNKGSRIGFKTVEKTASKKGAKGTAKTAGAKKVRFCKRCEEVVDQA